MWFGKFNSPGLWCGLGCVEVLTLEFTVVVTVLHTGIQERGDEDCNKRGI